MLCARYSYKTDLRVKAQEAYERGEKAGKKKDQTIATAKEMLLNKEPLKKIILYTNLIEEEI